MYGYSAIIRGMKTRPYPVTRPVDHRAWKFEDTQARMWIYTNLEDSQHNHLKGLAVAYDSWEILEKIYGTLGKERINFLKKKFFKYKAGSEASIDEISNQLTRLQMTIKDISGTDQRLSDGLAFMKQLHVCLIDEALHTAYEAKRIQTFHIQFRGAVNNSNSTSIIGF